MISPHSINKLHQQNDYFFFCGIGDAEGTTFVIRNGTYIIAEKSFYIFLVQI